MRTTCLLAAALWLAGIASAEAQRRIPVGPTYSSLSLEDQSGSSYSFPSYGGSVALITGDESETGLTIARYNNLSTDHGIRRLTLYGLDSYYYPVGARGVVAPFALTALGLARVRFRAATKKAGGLGLQIDYAPLEVTAGSCAPGCRPNAILFAPGYEASVRPAWGRVYGVVGFLLAGFYAEGRDRGMAQGAHGGVGADFYSGRAMWNLNARLLWLRRNGLVDSVRGAKGGYHLAREPHVITVKDVIEASEHVTFEVNCDLHPVDPQRCSPDAACSIRPVWRMLEQRINDLLAGISLADLTHDEPELYHIAGALAGN